MQPIRITTPGAWRGFVLKPSGLGEISLFRMTPPLPNPPPFPRFKITYDLTDSPFFSLVKLDEITGFIIGEPKTTGYGPIDSKAFYIDVCNEHMEFYRHNNPSNLIGTFDDLEFADMKSVSGLASSVIGDSKQDQCQPLPFCRCSKSCSVVAFGCVC